MSVFSFSPAPFKSSHLYHCKSVTEIALYNLFVVNSVCGIVMDDIDLVSRQLSVIRDNVVAFVYIPSLPLSRIRPLGNHTLRYYVCFLCRHH